MGFFSNLRAVSTVALATQFVQKHLEVESAAGALKRDPKKAAEQLVSALWASFPELANQQQKASPVVVAAAALAGGIKHFDSAGETNSADILHRCLGALVQYDLEKIVDVHRLTGIDSKLVNFAYDVMR